LCPTVLSSGRAAAECEPRATTSASKAAARMMSGFKEGVGVSELYEYCNECVCQESVSGRREALGVSWIRREEREPGGKTVG
jgi:hypothetical protein